MRPTQYDYDRYVWLVQLGKRLQWDDSALLAQNPFRVADPTMTFTLLRAQRDLAALGDILGEDVSAIRDAIAELEAGVDTLWNSALGAFDSRNTKTGEWSGSISNASFLCWYAGIDQPDMHNTLTDVLNEVQYGVPSLDPRSPKFDGKRYWRGPVWGIMNMLIATGMTEHGMSEGDALRRSTAKLISDHGFSEYFEHPH